VADRTGGAAQTGATTEWSFTGEQHDATGLEYLRARYYDASTGRFLSQDPMPLLQRYAYANDNPANLVDPSGLFSIKDAAGDLYAVAKQIVDDACWKTHMFCPHPALVWKAGAKAIAAARQYVRSAAAYALGAVGDCAESSECRGWVGTAFIVASLMIPGADVAMVAYGIGLAITTANDVHGCTSGDAFSCGAAVVDIGGVGAMGLKTYFGVTELAVLPTLQGYAPYIALESMSAEATNTMYALSTTRGATAASSGAFGAAGAVRGWIDR
jgi:RHS repeat-associated protein